MRTRKHARIRKRRPLSRAARRPRDPRSVVPEVREVRKAQVETGEELRDTRVPISTEPAFVFTA
jgi:hypothetical protein